MLVLVTGAGGQTGSIVVRRLLERGSETFTVRALVRSPESEAKLRESLGEELGRGLEVVHGDICKPESLESAFKGAEAVVTAASAMPKISKVSLAGVILTKLATLGLVSRKPSFWFEEGCAPEQVDWLGARRQIDLAKAEGCKHMVLVSSMAGTKPDHFLNTHMDRIVLWKRKAECYLMASGVPYTIIHPGGLLPHFGARAPAPGGRRPLYAALDDALLDDERKISTVPREDVAEVCVHCLLNPVEAAGRSFDLGSGPETEEEHPLDLKELLAPLEGKNCAYTEADANFLPEPPLAKSGRSCSPCGES
mmetsp:Transcript_73122/g.230953  ORF Transcript_73122/g.230953 Transcript_73122/m.230953 type:complete len:308 (+) Transcript_73122:72-995(+)